METACRINWPGCPNGIECLACMVTDGSRREGSRDRRGSISVHTPATIYGVAVAAVTSTNRENMHVHCIVWYVEPGRRSRAYAFVWLLNLLPENRCLCSLHVAFPIVVIMSYQQAVAIGKPHFCVPFRAEYTINLPLIWVVLLVHKPVDFSCLIVF